MKGIAGKLLVSALLLPLAGATMFSGMDRLSASQPALAPAVPAPFRWQAERAQATVAILQQDAAAAMLHAPRAVAADPVHPDATALLGGALLLNNDGPGAGAAFRQAAQFGWRNAMTQLYWFTAAAQSGDWAVAADRADAVLRANPGYPQAETLLAVLEENAQGRQELAMRLARRPVWTSRYLNLPDEIAAPAAARRGRIVAEVAGSGHPLGCDAIRRLTGQLLDRAQVATARQVWNAHCPQQPAGTGLNDPQFAALAAGSGFPFGWQVRTTGDVQAVPLGGGGVELANTGSVSRAVLVQPLFVEPGRYRLTANLEATGPAGEGSLLASAECGNGLTLPTDVDGSLASPAGQVLTIPDCESRRLVLWIKRGSGLVRLREVALSRL